MTRLWWALILFMLQEPAAAQQDLKRDYRQADSVASALQGYSLDDIPLLSRKLTSSLSSEEEKFRAIYYWVCHNIGNDYEAYQANRINREKWMNDSVALRKWEIKFTEQQIRSLLRQRRTVCTGYTGLVRDMALHAGLECVSINGYGRTAQAHGNQALVNHSWNAVKLNGTWYLCDPTWSSGYVNTQDRLFTQDFFEGYFLAPPKLFVLNHYPQDPSWTLLDNAPPLSEFFNRPLIYRSAYTHSVTDIAPDEFRITCLRKEEISFSFQHSSTEAPAVMLAVARAGQNGVLKKPTALKQAPGQIDFTHRFTSRGLFALHVLINGEYTYTYEVDVR